MEKLGLFMRLGLLLVSGLGVFSLSALIALIPSSHDLNSCVETVVGLIFSSPQLTFDGSNSDKLLLIEAEVKILPVDLLRWRTERP